MPVSRILFSDFSEPSSFIFDSARTEPVTPNPSVSREPRSSTDIRGLSIRKVYPLTVLLRLTVSSYLTFSPLPRRIVAVIFCGTCCYPNCLKYLPVRKYGALCCPDFPPPVSRRRQYILQGKDKSGFLNRLTFQVIQVVNDHSSQHHQVRGGL